MNTTKTGFTLFLTNTSNTETKQARFYQDVSFAAWKELKCMHYTKTDTAN